MLKTERVEKDVPIPAPGGRPADETALTASLRLLTPGDSFAVEKRRRGALAVAVTREQIRNGTKFTTRMTDDGRVRVWRIMS